MRKMRWGLIPDQDLSDGYDNGMQKKIVEETLQADIEAIESAIRKRIKNHPVKQ